MKPPEEVRRDFCRDWLRKAEDDLDAARHLLGAGESLLAIVAFHCQQAAEKALKAFLTWHQVEFPKTHDLRLLLDLIAKQDDELAGGLAPAEALTPFGVEYRYPGDYPEVYREEASQALGIATDVRNTVRGRLPLDVVAEE